MGVVWSATAGLSFCAAGQAITPTRYSAEAGAFVGRNLDKINNRPLYCNNTNSYVLAGDRPLIRLTSYTFGRGYQLHGTFLVGVVRGNQAKWLHDAGDTVSEYRADRMTWTMHDRAFRGLIVTLKVTPLSGAAGMAAWLHADGARTGDRLVWAYGGATNKMNASSSVGRSFVPQDASGNDVRLEEGGFLLTPPALNTPNIQRTGSIAGRCSVNTRTVVAGASMWERPGALEQSGAAGLPIVTGTVALDANKDVYWAVEVFSANQPVDRARVNAPAEAFSTGWKRGEELERRVTVSTPDERLNTLASAIAAELDGGWYPPVFVHSATSWNLPLPGWRGIFGATAYGWHDRVKEEAKYYISHQVRQSDKTRPKADPARLLTVEHADSRFYGRGYIAKDQGFYDMQTQFFDQILHDWRWTADPELESVLRPALDLHLEWMRECFDPDGDGLYESYINTWPTDSVWYNGGGSAEETAYAYRGHKAALDMARRVGDSAAVKFHSAMLEKIRTAFFERLWVRQKGHAGKYLEQGGHRRLHEDPWLYSIFLPIDAGMLTPGQAAESLYYPEWALQNDRKESGGRMVWTSNWVPGIWSVRPRAAGDNFHLALAYFQSGFAGDGWDVFLGTFLDTTFNRSPGVIGGESAHMLCRTMVEGLFGYSPDYPNGLVRLAPQFPAAWDHASIRTPDVNLRFERQGRIMRYQVELTKAAALDIRLPLPARGVDGVTVDGKPFRFELEPGFGQSSLCLQLPERRTARVLVTVRDPLPRYVPANVQGNVGDAITLTAENGTITGFSDPQGTLEAAVLREGSVRGRLASNPGHHTVIARADIGGAPQWRVFHVTVHDPPGDAAREAKLVRTVPANARWEPVDIGGVLNADVRTIYRQPYLSPRPKTVSVRIGSDGYSPWTFTFWKNAPPIIQLNSIPKLLDQAGRIVTPQGVPFIWQGGEKNIAFTSLWDNWPERVSVPVHKKGEALWILISGSTNPMQCGIANAQVRMRYADGREEILQLIPPVNYWTLSPLTANPSVNGQTSGLVNRTDYNYEIDAFALPKQPPETVQLGENCRAMLLSWKLIPGLELESVTLETLSQEVVVGLMGLAVMNPVAR
ncbi:MAG: DUF4450 domain-containing protein [Acidobacteria bacterium]|nr:DUF4450 domain-containing protein [Acidobacteriota bacterium]